MSQSTQVIIDDNQINPELVQKLVMQNPITGYGLMSLMRDDVVVAQFRDTSTKFIEGILKSYHAELRKSQGL